MKVVSQQGGRSIMVWAGFTCDCKITLEVIKGNKTAAKFRDEILHDVILLLASSPS